MKFLDEARIEVKAGSGGAGMCHFRREKFIPMGGPDGGDGGQGGSIIIQADTRRHTLLDLHMHPIWKAENGKNGGTNNRSGRSGADLTILVPVGTQVFRHGEEIPVCDLAENGMSFLLAQGGRGGKGNTFFKSATNQAPRHSQPGEEGEAGVFQLILKLVADVGLIGLPNSGKSTLISRISAARPKIADYPFTTLIPNLGVVKFADKSFVVADIPGLIPGAHEGKGLGIKFLKHVERTRLLVHLVDCSLLLDEDGKDSPFASFDLINHELSEFSSELSTKPQIVALSKADTLGTGTTLLDVQRAFQARGSETLIISSVTGEGIQDLIQVIGRRLFLEDEDPEA